MTCEMTDARAVVLKLSSGARSDIWQVRRGRMSRSNEMTTCDNLFGSEPVFWGVLCQEDCHRVFLCKL